jgi:hypothetical protein
VDEFQFNSSQQLQELRSGWHQQHAPAAAGEWYAVVGILFYICLRMPPVAAGGLQQLALAACTSSSRCVVCSGWWFPDCADACCQKLQELRSGWHQQHAPAAAGAFVCSGWWLSLCAHAWRQQLQELRSGWHQRHAPAAAGASYAVVVGWSFSHCAHTCRQQLQELRSGWHQQHAPAAAGASYAVGGSRIVRMHAASSLQRFAGGGTSSMHQQQQQVPVCSGLRFFCYVEACRQLLKEVCKVRHQQHAPPAAGASFAVVGLGVVLMHAASSCRSCVAAGTSSMRQQQQVCCMQWMDFS